jgi:protocatechuate 3,4-dioxygenase beta subunit
MLGRGSIVGRVLVFSLVCLVSVGAASAAVAAPRATTCKPTESDGLGPFGQGGSAPLRAKFGTGFVLSGRVLRSLDCKPLAGAVIELWQAGKNGYDRKGRASAITGRNGGFRFTGPAPVAYSTSAHIHIRVSADGFDDVVTTIRVSRGARSARVEVVLGSTL